MTDRDTAPWDRSPLAMAGRRLVSNRYTLGAAAILFVGLFAAGLIPLSALLICIAVMSAVSVFAPVRTAKARIAEQVQSAPLAGAHSRSTALLDSLPDPVMILDQAGVVVQTNKECRRIFRDTVYEGVSTMMRFRHPELSAMIGQALAGDTPAPVEVLERSPIERWFEAAIVQLPAEDPPDARFVLHFRDLSEIHRLDRMRSDFIANASHELRTPLASLSGFIETLAGPARDDTGARDKFLPIMQEQADRMSRLIDDLLSLSRLETALGRTDFEPVDLAEVLQHVRSALVPVAAEAGVTLNCDFDHVGSPDSLIFGSRDELIQVFANLLENAIRYGATGGKVDFNSRRVEFSGADSVQVTVRDYGPGIPEEHIPRLTERFYRVDVESSHAKKGTGLGLAIVKHIVTRHQGRLAIKSDPGNGATFIITLPIWVAGKDPEFDENG